MKKLISLVLIALICVGLLVACGPSEQDRLNAAKDYLDVQMKNKGEVTNGDYVVYDVLTMNENGTPVKYSVTWTVTKRDGTAISADDVKVDVNAETGETKVIVNKMAEADIEYILTATIKNANGLSVTVSYNRKVPKFVENTHEEYLAAATGDALIVKGIITSIVNTDTNKEIYIQDNDGGYYVYGVDADVIADLQIGQEVRVRGEKKLYNGIAEVVEPTIEVLNATPVAVNPVDITDAIANISDLSSDAALKYQGMFVKINGAFILGQVSTNNTYYDVLVNGKDGKLLQTYLRISSSANPLNETDTEAFKNTFKDNVGKDADISGVVSIYGGKIYLIPCRTNALENFQTVDRNDAGKLAIEQIIMDKVYDITEAGKVTLQSAGKTYTDVTFTWSLTANDYVTLNGNVLNTPVLPDEATTITLALTIKAGEATEVKTYTVKVDAAPTVVADTDIEVVPGTVYVFFVNQKNIPQKLYWDGSIKPNTSYLQTTTNPDKAAKVVAQLVEGTTDKYILYRDVNGAKQYINVLDNEKGTSPSVILDRYETNVKNYFSYNAEIGIFTVDATVKASKDSTETAVKTFYFGCYNQFDTFSLSEIKYITGDKAANLDVSQHPARFATLVDTEKLTNAEMINREKTDLDIKVDFAAAGTINLPANGGLFGKVVITWAAATNNGAVVIENGVLTATPQDAETTVVVTATLALGDATDTKTFNVVVAKIPSIVPVKVDTPALNTPYKFALNQQTIGKFLYFNGTTTDFLGTTEDYAQAVDVYIKEVSTGAYTISFMDGTTEKFVEIYKNSSDKVRIQIVDASTMTYSYDETLGVYFATIEGKGDYYIGAYDTFDTFSASATKYITNAGNFTACFYTMIDSSAVSDADQVAYEKGAINLADKIESATTITLPVASLYEDVVIEWSLGGTYTCATLENGVLTITIPDVTTVITLNATISLGDATDTFTKDISVVAPSIPYELGVAYKAYFIQGGLNNTTYYFTGALTGGRFGTTSKYGFYGVDVYFEETTGGYYMYFMDGTTKTYLDQVISGTYTNFGLTTTPNAVWRYDFDLNTFVATSSKDSLDYYLGTYNSYETISLSKTSQFSSTSYVLKFVLSSEIPAQTEADKLAEQKELLSIDTSFDANGSITLPSVGSKFANVTITWTKDGVAYTDSTLTITQTSEKQTIVLVATLALEGCESLTKEFTVTVAAKVDESAIKTYTMQAVVNGTTYYWTGAASSGKGALTTDASKAATVYVVAVDGGYNVYIMDGATKKYLNLTKDANTGFYTGDVSLVQITDGKISFTDANGNTRYVATYGTQDIRTYKLTNNMPGGQSSNAYMLLVEADA